MSRRTDTEDPLVDVLEDCVLPAPLTVLSSVDTIGPPTHPWAPCAPALDPEGVGTTVVWVAATGRDPKIPWKGTHERVHPRPTGSATEVDFTPSRCRVSRVGSGRSLGTPPSHAGDPVCLVRDHRVVSRCPPTVRKDVQVWARWWTCVRT